MEITGLASQSCSTVKYKKITKNKRRWREIIRDQSRFKLAPDTSVAILDLQFPKTVGRRLARGARWRGCRCLHVGWPQHVLPKLGLLAPATSPCGMCTASLSIAVTGSPSVISKQFINSPQSNCCSDVRMKV
ncbi:hypothetical protein BaRGS_00007150 [Batillaria attramentaria]|uniref:Uncharacterized protein n=1 Tax=Batillaria attramentaria TaxID=370345 RepID=A0ABD0LQD7_9CAEN